MIILIDREKHLKKSPTLKTQLSFMIKILNKLGMKSIFFKLRKVIYKNPYN